MVYKPVLFGYEFMNQNDLTHNDLSFLETLGKYSFESKMLACQKYACKLMTPSEVSMEAAYSENIMPWELETFSMFSVAYDDDNATEPITLDAFADIITKIRNYWHSELTMAEANGTYADSFMMISGLQQFSVQGLILQKLFRAAYFFGYSDDNVDLERVFYEKFGCKYTSFDTSAFMLYLSCCNDKKLDSVTKRRLVQLALEEQPVVKGLQIEKAEFKRQLQTLYKDTYTDYYYGLKLQYIWPIIGDDKFNYIPLPYLVINAVTESFLNRLTEGNKHLREALGENVLENYLYDIYSEVSTVSWISQEIPYIVGKDKCLTPDVIVCEENYCTFYDTKALSPSLKIRKFEKDEIDKNIGLYARALMEIYKQILRYGEDCFSLDKRYEKRNIFGVAVVLEDSYISRRSVYDYVFCNNELSDDEKEYIHSHIKIVSLRQIEHMVLQNTSFLKSLLNQVSVPERWDDMNYVMATTENGIIPRYKQYVEDLKARARAKVGGI